MDKRAHLHVAPLRLRFAASIIDAVVAIGALGIVLGAVIGASIARGERAPRSARWITKIAGSGSGKLALELCLCVVSVLFTGRQGPGSRIVGIRLADARTGRPPSRRQAILRVGVQWAWRKLTSRPKTQPVMSNPEGLDNLRSEIDAFRHEHGGDQEALQQAMMRAYHEHKQQTGIRVSALAVLIRLVLAAAIDAPVLWSALNQGLPDMLARTVVIVDR